MNPLVSVTIQEDYRDWQAIKGIQLEGIATCVEGADQRRATLLYRRKFPLIADLLKAPTEIVKAMSRIAWYKIEPVRLYFIDNSLGLGHREEVPADFLNPSKPAR